MPSIKLLIITIVLLGILGFRFHDYYKSLPVYEDGKRYKVTGIVSDEPKFSFGKQRVKVRTPDGVRVTLVTQAAPMYEYGEDLEFDGVFTKQEFEGHTYWVSYNPHIKVVKNEGNVVITLAENLRDEAKKLVQSTLPPASSSLLLGIVLGGKHGMPEEFLENLRTVGVMHVIAASGMNVSFVAIFLLAVFGKFMKRRFALFTTVLGIAFYVTVAGFEPSIVRAAIMSSLAFSAAILGRQSIGVVTLFLTGYIMLLFNPGLWEDVGFQLSFLSTLGILVVKPVIGELGRLGSLGRLVSDDVGSTVAAQIATLPILLGVFGSYGVLSVVINAVILWTVPVLMALGSLGILGGLVFAPFGKLVLFLCYPFLWYFETVVNLFGSSGWVLTIPEVPWVIWVGYYLLLGAWVLGNRRKVVSGKESLILREV